MKFLVFVLILVAATLTELRAEEFRKPARYALWSLDRAVIRAAFSSHPSCTRAFGQGLCGESALSAIPGKTAARTTLADAKATPQR